MSFAPILPLSGTAGWALLKRTMAAQTAALNASPEMARDADYFSANIGKITSADQLVNDRRLLKVALGAFGLEGDIANKAFIKRVLTDGTQSKTALANKLADKRYAQLSAAFGFDRGEEQIIKRVALRASGHINPRGVGQRQVDRFDGLVAKISDLQASGAIKIWPITG